MAVAATPQYQEEEGCRAEEVVVEHRVKRRMSSRDRGVLQSNSGRAHPKVVKYHPRRQLEVGAAPGEEWAPPPKHPLLGEIEEWCPAVAEDHHRVVAVVWHSSKGVEAPPWKRHD